MGRRSSAVVAAILTISMLQGSVRSARAGTDETTWYLALGTSLAVGFQPGRGETPKGYVDALHRTYQAAIPALALRNVGCPGETSRSMITGRGSLCRYAAGSQLDAAVAFLTAHPGQVAFVTLEVGANDLLGACMRDTWRIDRACAADVMPRLQTRLTRIVGALRAAGPDAPIVAMNYYDPLLGLWGLVPGGRALAHAAQRVWTDLNATLATAYGDAGAAVADVAATFRIDDFTGTIVVPGRGPLPTNVALTCMWTWFCTPRFAGDPHTNAIGYRKIAQAFGTELDALLPATSP
jgi:lysophospholipase L1-like esterase